MFGRGIIFQYKNQNLFVHDKVLTYFLKPARNLLIKIQKLIYIHFYRANEIWLKKLLFKHDPLNYVWTVLSG